MNNIIVKECVNKDCKTVFYVPVSKSCLPLQCTKCATKSKLK